MSRLKRNFSRWVYLVLPLGMSLVASSLITRLQQSADDARSTQLQLTHIQSLIYQLHAIEEEAVAEKRVTPKNAELKDAIDEQVDMALLNLQQGHSHDPRLEFVQNAFTAFDESLDKEFPFLKQGNIEAAEKIADESVDPNYEELKRKIEEANTFYHQQATEKKREANLGVTILLVSGAMCLGAFMQRIAKSHHDEVLQQTQRLEDERMRAVLETALDAVIAMDSQGIITNWNRQAETIFGWTKQEAIGKPFAEVVFPEAFREINQQEFANYLAGETGQFIGQRVELDAIHRQGHLFPITMSLSCVRAGDRLTFNAFICDISERKAAEDRLEHQALHDALTGLPNRLLFHDRLGAALSRMGRLQTGIAVLFVDLDNFKLVNDSMGHEAGDILLKTIAERLENAARRGDTIARMGGDEFTLLLENVNCTEDATYIAERIVTQLQQPIHLGEREVFASASIGVAFTQNEAEDVESLLRDADTAMYQAKLHGKSGYVVFNASMNADVVERMEIETDLRLAVEREELRVHYQPLINLESGCMNGVEALVRWQHPEKGLMPPGKFIPIAEETGLIIPIGYWVLEEACRQMQAWKETYPHYGELTVNVNLSGKQLQHPDVVERVREILERTQLMPSSLKLEITESVMMADVDDTVAKLHGLKALGVKLALDDFGTGYSSMASLNLFPLDTVKIDRSFIKRLTEHREAGSIVSAIIMLSKALNLDVTGEGVETSEQLAQLQELGCHIGQGYLFAKPLPAPALSDGIAAGPHHFASSLQQSGIDVIEQHLKAA